MKKFLSLTVALAMAVAMVPATAFAKSDMKISRTVTAESDDYLYTGSKIGDEETRVAPFLTLTADGTFKTQEQTFRLKLTNAEWIDETGAELKDLAKDITVKDASGNSLITAGSSSVSAAEKALADAIKALGSTGVVTEGVKITVDEFDSAYDVIIANGLVDEKGVIKTGKDETDVAKALAPVISSKVDALINEKTTANPAAPTQAAQDALAALEKAVLASNQILSAAYKLNVDSDASGAADGGFVKIEADAKKLYAGEDGKGGELADYALDVANEIGIDASSITADSIETAIEDYLKLSANSAKDRDDAIEDFFDLDPSSSKILAGPFKGSAIVGTDAKAALIAYDAAKLSVKTQTDLSEQNINKQAAQITTFNKVRPGSTSSGSTTDLTVKVLNDKYKEVSGDRTNFIKFLVEKGVTTTADQIKLFDLTKTYVDAVAGGGDVVTGGVTVEKITDTLAMVTIRPSKILPDDAEVTIPLYTKLTGGETATVEVDPRDSEFSSDSKTFAKVAEGSTQSYTDGTKNFYDGDTLKTIYIDEVSSDTFKYNPIGVSTSNIKDKFTVKLSSGFKWGFSKDELIKSDKIKIYNADTNTKVVIDDVDGNEITFHLEGNTGSKNPATIKLADMIVKEDGADFGTTCKVTVSGGGITKNTIEVGTYADFGLTLTAESKALPVIYAGSYDSDNETLKVTFEETVQNSWIPTRKTELVLPEGVKFVEVDVKKTENINMKDGSPEFEQVLRDNIDGSKITIPAGAVKNISSGKKAKFEAVFTITADPTFSGDVELTAQGPGVGNETLSKTIATVNSPLTVKSSVNEVIIDYRNVGVNAITITEAEAGLWEKGDKITLQVEEMQFESGITAEVVSGDMKLEKLDGDNVKVDKKEGTVTIQVKSTSSSTPAEIKIDGIQLYLDRSLPAGDYELSVVSTSNGDEAPQDNKKDKDLLFANYREEKTGWDTDKFGETSFETDSVTVLKDFVKVVTGGRDQGTSTFTTKIVVPVGSDKITAGQKEITIDAPAYINADGYTMLPVRAVIDALNGLAVVRWDDASKTCTISFGDRIFAMTVGSKTMNMNGVATALLAAPEIKNERIFLPLRDLGYALGLTDAKIQWDAATNTATLN